MQPNEKALFHTLGKRVRQQRIALGMTQEQLAEKTAISPSFVGHIEQATRIPSMLTAMRLAKALNVKIDALVCDETLAPDLEQISAAIKEAARQLDLYHSLVKESDGR